MFTEYLHLIVTSKENITSLASLDDVVNLTLLMKKVAMFHKTACVRYMCKGNTVVEKEITSITVACQESDHSELTSRNLPAHAENIKSKLEDIAHWFNNDSVEEQKDEVNESISSMDFRAEIKRRCIVMSVCLPDNIVDQTTSVDSLAAL